MLFNFQFAWSLVVDCCCAKTVRTNECTIYGSVTDMLNKLHHKISIFFNVILPSIEEKAP